MFPTAAHSKRLETGDSPSRLLKSIQKQSYVIGPISHGAGGYVPAASVPDYRRW